MNFSIRELSEVKKKIYHFQFYQSLYDKLSGWKPLLKNLIYMKVYLYLKLI